MRVRFLGHTSCVPDPGTDTSCLLVNDRVLFDTGWAPVLRMRELGLDPLEIRGILFSHFHPDHYLGLAQMLFMLGLRLPGGAEEPRRQPLIAGPREHLEHIVQATQAYLQWGRLPQLALNHRLVPTGPGDVLDVDGLRIEVFAANHVSGHGDPEPALAYRVTEESSGGSFFFSGDTHPCPELAEPATGVQLLIHDSAHSTPEQAAETARQAGVEQLILAHLPASACPDAVARARTIFANAEAAGPNQVIEVPPPG
ncbi:MBL fold metallo-hydrolase [Candidatus Latescibacterota bacterium]